ncbi:hypothetical protein ACFQ0P_07510 [Microbacterium insulae]|uniref:Integrase catalytic domain-containing protein n=1 Tax=Microbacterium insulae TaxID=483014 RepID=A0ABW3AH17_9MICO
MLDVTLAPGVAPPIPDPARRFHTTGSCGLCGNALIEAFWSTMQREPPDRTSWDYRAQLASAIFERIEGFYNPRRRHHQPRQLQPRRR